MVDFAQADKLTKLWDDFEAKVLKAHPLELNTTTGLCITRVAGKMKLVYNGTPLAECKVLERIQAINCIVDFKVVLKESLTAINDRLAKAVQVMEKECTLWGYIDMSTEAEFLQELHRAYPMAKIAPGMQSAWLADQQAYYIAVHIFPKGTLASRFVMAKAVEPTYEGALNKCIDTWRSLYKQAMEHEKAAGT